jgi:large subunit ribosomal protein L17
MRHGNKINHLGRTASHRKAMLSNMASSLILHKRITTTVAKAKALRQYVEPLITKSKTDSTHSRRVVFSYLQDKESVKVLFDEVSEKVAERPGGYTRIIKTGNRLGDNAEMCIMELVDFNELLLGETDTKKAKTRRSRRGKKSTDAEVAPPVKAKSKVEGKDKEAEVVKEEKATSKAVVETVEEQVEEVKVVSAEEQVEEVKAEASAEDDIDDSSEKPDSAAENEEDSKKE